MMRRPLLLPAAFALAGCGSGSGGVFPDATLDESRRAPRAGDADASDLQPGSRQARQSGTATVAAVAQSALPARDPEAA